MSLSVEKSLLPTNLPLAQPDTPWRVSKEVFERLQPHSGSSFKQCQLLPSDPDYQFVYRYFHHELPTNRAIKRVFCGMGTK